MLTGEQIRAARAFVRIEQAELARRSNLSLETIKRLERIRGRVDANVRTLAAITDAFELSGIAFDFDASGVGVRFADSRPANADVYDISHAQHRHQSTHRLIYHSRSHQITPGMIANIEHVSAARNRLLGVTGVLLVCDGRFMQVLEGAKGAVRQVYGSVSADPRHGSLEIIETGDVARRRFSDWTTCVGRLPPEHEYYTRGPSMPDGFRPEYLSAQAALELLSAHRDLRRGGDESVHELNAAPRQALSAL
jgi:transcriptional regulator with XRE-family HTH domain